MTAKDMVSQNTRRSCRLAKSMNVFEKKKSCVPFLSSKPRPKKGRKHLAVNRQQTPLRAAKVLFTTGPTNQAGNPTRYVNRIIYSNVIIIRSEEKNKIHLTN